MYEEDRVRALAMYNSMFDETDDETGLLQLLVSPTRQAVNLARSYDARERKLQAHAQAREAGETAEEEPSFVQVIERIRDQAAALGAKAPAVSDDQFSLFEDADLDTSVFDDVAAQLDGATDEPEPFTLPVEHEPARFPDEDAAQGAEAPAAQPEEKPQPEKDAAPQDEAPAPTAAETTAGSESAPEEKPAEASNPEDAAVDAFLADFSIAGSELAQNAEPAVFEGAHRLPDEDAAPAPAPVLPEEPEAAPAGEAVFQAPAAQAKEEVSAQFAAPAAPAAQKPAADKLPDLPDLPSRTVRKPRVFLLLVFLLFAIPITLLGIALLLLPTLLSLAAGAAAIGLGTSGLVAAFGSFSVFADILLVLGCALVALALGLLLAWTFIWFIGGAIPALVRGVAALSRKWCYKEVEVR